MITKTSFNPSFLAKVRQAMREAVVNAASWSAAGERSVQRHVKGVAYVRNHRGVATLRVDYSYGQAPAFRFWEGSRKDITPLATTCLEGRV